MPDEVRAEVSARSVADQHRALREAARGAERVARPRAEAAERRLRRERRPRGPRERAQAVQDIAAARLRRSRVLATNVLVVGITVSGWGVSDVAAGGGVDFLAVGVVLSLAAIALLQRSSTVAAAHRAVEAVDSAVVVPDAPSSFTDWQAAEPSRPTWTPVPLPRPMYLQREQVPAPARDDVAIAASLRAAAARADEALRAAHAAPEIAALNRPLDEVAAAMNESGPVLADLDGVLRRRRAS
ncbi:hypothetical protein [Amnibacterium endophyticum]|uniref:SMODS and SLOG-associating 2TM effector domain-containing protein n=1 Tax=Amnibacterium endophyticum TaxID=2109337 RepID=A0ABW4LDP4_9MICO